MGFLVKKVTSPAPPREASRWVTCGECNGNRVVPYRYREPDSSTMHEGSITCPECGGRGRVRD